MSAAFLKIEKNDIWQFIDQKRKKKTMHIINFQVK